MSTSDYRPSTAELEGIEVWDRDGNKVGKVDEIYVDDASSARYLGVKTGWFGSKHHVIPLDDAVLSEDPEGRYIQMPYTKDELREAPTFEDLEELDQQQERDIYGHYGRQGYWEYVRAKQTTPAPTPEIAQADVAADMERGQDPLRHGAPRSLGHNVEGEGGSAEGQRGRVRRWTP